MKTFLIRVNDKYDIGRNEIERNEIIEEFCLPSLKPGITERGIKYAKAKPAKDEVKHEDETADSAPKEEEKNFGEFLKGKVVTIETDKGNLRVWGSDTAPESKLTWANKTNDRIQKAEAKFNKQHTKLCTKVNRLESLCNKYDERIDAMVESSDDWAKEGNLTLEINTNEIKYLKQQLSELQQAFVKYAICAKPDPQYIASEHIEPGQLLCRNADGTVKPTGVNEIPDGIACPPSGNTEQANCSKEEDEVEEAKKQLIEYELKLGDLKKLGYQNLLIEVMINRYEHEINKLKEFLKNYKLSKTIEYRLVCNNCSPKCVLHFDNHDLPMAVPDCPWHRNTKEWELQCKLSDELWRKAEWNPER